MKVPINRHSRMSREITGTEEVIGQRLRPTPSASAISSTTEFFNSHKTAAANHKPQIGWRALPQASIPPPFFPLQAVCKAHLIPRVASQVQTFSLRETLPLFSSTKSDWRVSLPHPAAKTPYTTYLSGAYQWPKQRQSD